MFVPMKFFLKILLSLIVFLVFAVAYYSYTQFNAFKLENTQHEIQSFEIKKGSNIQSVSKSLSKQGIVSSSLFFRVLAKLTKQENRIKAGEYHLKKGLTPSEILDLFSKGKTIQYQTRLPEGITFKDLISIIKADKNLKQTLSDDDYTNIMGILKTEYKHHKPEGWFYPDTYSYPRGTTDLQFLQRSHNAMKKVLAEEWKEYKPVKGITSPYDVLILASIVEKETGDPSDRSKVAKVFINRLKKGMLLQTDPTVIYGMGENYQGNIRKKDLRNDTPYNTYTRKGLTPTPISIPSAASIKSVINPAKGEMLYFVAKGDGKSHFSKTYSEHKKAVIKYLLNGKARRYKGD